MQLTMLAAVKHLHTQQGRHATAQELLRYLEEKGHARPKILSVLYRLRKLGVVKAPR